MEREDGTKMTASSEAAPTLPEVPGAMAPQHTEKPADAAEPPEGGLPPHEGEPSVTGESPMEETPQGGKAWLDALIALSALVWMGDCAWLLYLFIGWWSGEWVWSAWVYGLSVLVLPTGLFAMFAGLFVSDYKSHQGVQDAEVRAERRRALRRDLLSLPRLALGYALMLLSFPSMIYALQLLIWWRDGISFPWWHLAVSVAIPVAAVLTRVPQEGQAFYYSPEEVAKREAKRVEREAKRAEERLEWERRDAEEAAARERRELKRLGYICPRCGSDNVMHIGTQESFSLSRAGLGYLLFGGKGLLAGAAFPEAGKRVFRCLDCGKKYKVR